MRLATGLMIAGVFLLPAAAWAQDPGGDIPPPPPPPSSDELVVTAKVYGWLAGVSGPAEVSSSTPAPPFRPRPDIESDSSGVFDNLDFFGFAVGEVSKGNFGATLDVAYVSFTFDDDVIDLPGPLNITSELELDASVTTIEGFYRFRPAEDVDLDLMGGVRVFWLDLGLKVYGPGGGTILQGDAEDTWADAIVGGRARWTPGNWTFSAQGDIGAGDDTSDWNVFLLGEYRFGDHFGVMGGYRWLEFEYNKGGRDVDLTLDGPIIGATWTF